MTRTPEATIENDPVDAAEIGRASDLMAACLCGAGVNNLEILQSAILDLSARVYCMTVKDAANDQAFIAAMSDGLSKAVLLHRSYKLTKN